MLIIRAEQSEDQDAVESLLDSVFGDSRFKKTCELLRRGNTKSEELSFIAKKSGSVIGSVRLWPVTMGTYGSGMMLGPLAVSENHRSSGIGSKLVRHAIDQASKHGVNAVFLVGDPEYYERFGFKSDVMSGFFLPGPFERHRFMGLDLSASKSLIENGGMIRVESGEDLDILKYNLIPIAA